MRVPAPKKSLGQHFLSDPELLRRIVAEAGVGPRQRVVEVGPGPGGLTRALLEAGAEVWAVETDPRMVEYLEGLGLCGLRVEEADALAFDFLGLAARGEGKLRFVSNLPYNISGPMLAKLLHERAAFDTITVMLQREVAERLLAPPGTKVRGKLSALSQAFCSLRPLLRVPAGSFRPPPKVDSMVVRMDVLDEPVAPLGDEEVLWRAVSSGFSQKRKMLRNSLRAVCSEPESVLAEAGLAGTERAEELSSEAWIRLANVLARNSAAAEG
jgi:16S rRNA (adenine1518-N6/adenine1519-N6)-dimethyltransferase